jgi:hypothetical protein
MSNIIEETDLFNELLNWAHGDNNSQEIMNQDAIFIEEAIEKVIEYEAIEVSKQQTISETIKQHEISEAIKQHEISEAIKQHEISEAIKQDAIFIKDAISEIKTQMALIETRSNQIDMVIQNITQITIAIDNMKVELAATDQLENKYTILHKIMMFEISYVVITRAFLTSIEAAEITIINMVEKTITIAVMIAAIDKTNKNAEIIVSKLTDLMVTWKKKTDEAEIAKNKVMMFITSTQTPTSLLNLPEIITAYTTEINKRTICNTFIDIVKQWVLEYS